MTHHGPGCKICDMPTQPFSRARIMYKYEIQYYRCPYCEFVQTEEPYWLTEAYTNPIIPSDIGLIVRNTTMSDITKAVLYSYFDRNGSYVDYGGGYGMLTRMMRDAGYRFRHYDPFCPNLFAKGFEADFGTGEKFELATAFELFENLPYPLQQVGEILQRANGILFSTDLLPQHHPKPAEWWYYALDGGQHVSIYGKKSLQHLAERLGMRLVTNGASLHLLTGKFVDDSVFELLTRADIAKALSPFTQLPSLLGSDYQNLLNREQK